MSPSEAIAALPPSARRIFDAATAGRDLKPYKLPDQSLLRLVLEYQIDGSLIWRPRHESLFNSISQSKTHSAATWNTRFAGKEALSSPDGEGYKGGYLFGRIARSHRVIWKYHTGLDPEFHIDHINGDRRDNRIENLREVTPAENSKNSRLPKDNKSGHVGVCWDRRAGKWVSRINVARKRIEIGRFHNIEDAVASRVEYQVKLGFHKNHGTKRGIYVAKP